MSEGGEIDALIAKLDLAPHPEGGFYRETFRQPATDGGRALATTILFARIRVGAAILLLPYLAWICFAGYLLYQINELNPNAASLVPSRSADQIQIH